MNKAFNNQNTEIMKLLINKGANLETEYNDVGEKLLHMGKALLLY